MHLCIGTILDTRFEPNKFLALLLGFGAFTNIDTKLALLYFGYFVFLVIIVFDILLLFVPWN